MSNSYPASPIRLQVSPAPNPASQPIDAATLDLPAFYRSTSVAVEVGIFDAFNNPVDLSNLSVLQLALFRRPTDPGPVVTLTLTQAQFDATVISWANWQAGIAQNATFVLSPADTDQGCDGQPSADYWLVVQGQTSQNQVIVYGAGYAKLFNSGNPSAMQALTAPSLQNWTNPSGAGATQVNPLTQFSTQVIAVSGSAGARTVIVSTAGMLAGATCSLIFNIPATAGIVMSILSGSPTGPAVGPGFTTSGGSAVTQIIYEIYFDGFNWTFKRQDGQ